MPQPSFAARGRRSLATASASVFGGLVAFSLVAFSLALSVRGATAASTALPAPPALAPEAVEFFESRIRPVLVESCFSCHDARKHKGGLDLTTAEGLRAGGDSGPPLGLDPASAPVSPGSPDASLLLGAIAYTGDLQMPPDGKLPDSVIADFRRWIEMGAPDPRATAAGAPEGAPANPADAGAPKPSTADMRARIDAGRDWWAFRPVADPTPPAPSASEPASDSLSPIDAFLRKELDARGLAPAPEASRAELIRRATFDLTGLPPTPEEIDAFVSDDATDAWDRLIERLLASPRYGERWGRHWLDVVRYTDSFDSRAGTDQDCSEAWRYRDWVVKSFNADLPFDRFLAMQVAGDLLAETEGGFDRDALIATGVLAFGNWPGGDADKEKMVADIVDDQVDLVTRGFLGVTLACARCHDHKFDPFATRDYYAVAGVFFSSHILPGPGKKTEGSPILKIPVASKDELRRRSEWIAERARVAELERGLTDARDRAIAVAMLPETDRYMLAAWERSRVRGDGADAPAFAAARGLNPDALVAWGRYLGLDASRLMTNPTRSVAGIVGVDSLGAPGGLPAITANATDREAIFATIRQPARSVSIHPAPSGSVAVAWDARFEGPARVSGRAIDADAVCGDGFGWSLRLRRGGAANPLLEGRVANGDLLSFRDAEGGAALERVEFRRGDRLELHVLPAGSHACDTTVVELKIEELAEEAPAGAEPRYWNLTEDVAFDLLARGEGNPHADKYGAPGVWSFLDFSEDPGATARHPGSALDAWREAARVLSETNSPEVDSEARRALERAAVAVREIAVGRLAEALAAPAEPAPPPDLALARDLVSPASPFHGKGAVNGRIAGGTPDGSGPGGEGRPARGLASLLVDRARARLASLDASQPPASDITIGIQEGGVPDTPRAGIRDVEVHVRGSYARLGEVVPRGVPEVLTLRVGQASSLSGVSGDGIDEPIDRPTAPSNASDRLEARPTTEDLPFAAAPNAIAPVVGDRASGRLELARWIASKRNPLTARVFVNRMWRHHFGRGIVPTAGNFGRLGEPPSHPELLDWLASRFMESGWSIKEMHRLMMRSAAYRASSRPTAALLEADPDNRLFGRMQRRRLSSEELRDAMLAVAGELDETPGGPAFPDLATPRRTLYLKTNRSDRADFRTLFDAADPTAIVDARTEATVAPQALFLLNSKFARDRAAAFADRIDRESAPGAGDAPDDGTDDGGGSSEDARIDRMTRLAFGRPATDLESELARSLSVSTPGGDAGSATDEAALREFAHVLLCADEFLYVD